MLRYLSAGESHGKALTAIIEGLPANVPINVDLINRDLKRRQQGYGRGKRMNIEEDKVEIITGVRNGKTMGSPITLMIKNRDYNNWKKVMGIERLEEIPSFITQPRPGHGDFAGTIKYNYEDIRNTIERASARETAIRTAVGSVAKQLLFIFGVEVFSHVIAIGSAKNDSREMDIFSKKEAINNSPVRCADKKVELKMIEEIERAKKNKDSVGGVFEVIIRNIPIGLGSHVHFDRKLDGLLAQGMMSLQGIKAVELGDGIRGAEALGSQFHDEIFYDEEKGYYRQSNSAGGIEAGITNGEDIIIKAYMKPIPTLMKPLNTVDMNTKETRQAVVERSDHCAVPAASIVGEAIGAWIIAKSLVEKFGGDSKEEMLNNYQHYLKYVKDR